MPNQNIVNPHFAVPFRFVGGSALCVEQDSSDDVTQCVEAIARTPRGSRLDIPKFGIPSQVLTEGVPSLIEIQRAIEDWEPRALLTMSQREFEDILSRTIEIGVDVHG